MRSQRHLRFVRGYDSRYRAAYEFGEPSRVSVSAQVARVSAFKGGAPPSNTVAPSFTGTLTVGQTLTAVPGTWTGTPSITRRWQRNGADIPGALGAGATYILVAADQGKHMGLVVTGTNSYGSSTKSAPTRGPVT